MRSAFGSNDSSPPSYDDGGGSNPFQGGAQMAWPSLTPMVKRLIWINVGVFLTIWLLAKVFAITAVGLVQFELLAIAPDNWREWSPFVPLWQLVSYAFCHDLSSPFHILWNMLQLYFFGTMLEAIIGGRRFLVFYLVAAVIGGTAQLGYELIAGQSAPTVGASGAVLAVLVAMAVLRPNQMVIVMFLPLTLKVLAMILVGLDLFMVLSNGAGSSQTAYMVHLGGAAFGFLAARQGWIWRDPISEFEEHKVAVAKANVVADDERMDELLAQINKEGMNSLSKRDRDFLRRMSKRK